MEKNYKITDNKGPRCLLHIRSNRTTMTTDALVTIVLYLENKYDGIFLHMSFVSLLRNCGCYKRDL